MLKSRETISLKLPFGVIFLSIASFAAIVFMNFFHDQRYLAVFFAFLYVFTGFASIVFTALLFYRIGNVVNKSANDTLSFLKDVRTEYPHPLNVPSRAFRMFVATDLIAYAFLAYWYMQIVIILISGLFFLVYLNHVFAALGSIYTSKKDIYDNLEKSDKNKRSKKKTVKPVKKRNVFVVAFLMIVTFGIYWLYLCLKLSVEINEFVAADEAMMSEISGSPSLKVPSFGRVGTEGAEVGLGRYP